MSTGNINVEGLLRSGAMQRAVLSAIPEPLFLLDRTGRYLAVFGGSDREKFHDAEVLVGKTLHDLMAKQLADEFLAQIDIALNTGSVVTYEYSLDVSAMDVFDTQTGPKGKLWYEAHISPVETREGQQEMVIWIAFNITPLKNALEARQMQEDLMRRLAMEDALTGLANRRAFMEHAGRLVGHSQRQGGSLVLLAMDIDHFKSINDGYGHAAGDAVLGGVAGLLRDACRKSDIAARIGGEEFAVLLPDCSLADGKAKAEALRQAIEAELFVIEGSDIQCTVSIGVSEVLEGEGSIEKSMGRADEALYCAKNSGRNRVCLGELDGLQSDAG